MNDCKVQKSNQHHRKSKLNLLKDNEFSDIQSGPVVYYSGSRYFCTPMKRFLVPVDFSKDAEAAFEYALHLAKGLKIQLFVIAHVVKTTIPAAGALTKAHEPDADAELARLTQQAEDQLGENVSVLSKVLRGKPEEVIERLAYQFEADLIVMGALGADRSGEEGFYLGTVSGSLFKHTELPMLFVPAGFAFEPPQKMAFILKSLMIYKPDALMPLLEITKTYGSELSVVQVKAASIDETYGKETNLDLAGTEYNVFQLSCPDVPSGIQKVIHTFEPQILCVIRRKRDFFESLFKSKAIPAKDFSSTVPLLVLQGLR